MTRQTAQEYIGHYVDDALNTASFPITKDVRLVGYQCGFEPMFVAVRSYLDVRLNDQEAEELAQDLLVELKWFGSDISREADYIL